MPSKAAPPPRPLSRSGVATATDAEAERSQYEYQEFSDDASDECSTKDVQVLPPNSQLQHRLREKAGLAGPAADSAEVDFNAAEKATFGRSSRLVKKTPKGAVATDADVDELKSAVLSGDKEIISQG